MSPRVLRGASFRAQIVFATTALVAALMIVVGLGIQLMLDLTARSDIDNALTNRADTVVAAVRGASDTTLTVPQAALDPGVMVFDGSGRLLAGTIERRGEETAERLATATRVVATGAYEDLRLRAQPFRTPSGDRGVVVVSVLATPYERSEQYALIATIVLGLIVVATTGVVAAKVTDQALQPVSQMAERAAEWSEHDLARRFDLGPPTNELAELGQTLDHLLDRVAHAILAEQRLTAELAHELRTPLTAIQGSADLALMRGIDEPDLRREVEQVSESARDMAVTITTLLDLARDHARGKDRDTCTVADLLDPLRDLVPGHLHLAGNTDSSAHVRLAAPAALVIRALAPLMHNAARHARLQVGFSAAVRDRCIDLSISDDGTGIDQQIRERIFEPGVSGTDGSGLGLGIARRVARSLGGDVVVDAAAEPTTLTVRIPLA